MRKFAFTLSEVVIALVVFGVIAGLVYPTLANLRPDNNIYMVKRAYYQAETVVAELINSPLYPQGTGFGAEFPQRFCDKLNLTEAETNTCTTTDGTVWKFDSPTVLTVTVNEGKTTFKINIRADGKMEIDSAYPDAIEAIKASTYK